VENKLQEGKLYRVVKPGVCAGCLVALLKARDFYGTLITDGKEMHLHPTIDSPKRCVGGVPLDVCCAYPSLKADTMEFEEAAESKPVGFLR
jgi:hypothetical protein